MEEKNELQIAWEKLFNTICEEIGIKKFLDWLVKKIE